MSDFNPYDQRFAIKVEADNTAWIEIDQQWIRLAKLDAHIDQLRQRNSNDVTYWKVSRAKYEEPVVEQFVGGVWFTKRGHVADVLHNLAIDGLIDEPMDDEEAEYRREEDRYDEQMRRNTELSDAHVRTLIECGRL